MEASADAALTRGLPPTPHFSGFSAFAAVRLFLRALSLNSLRLSSCEGRDPHPGTSLTLRVLSDLLPTQAFEMGTCIILCLQMRKLKHRGEMTHSRPVVGRARN